jgi:hypothetical protein
MDIYRPTQAKGGDKIPEAREWEGGALHGVGYDWKWAKLCCVQVSRRRIPSEVISI